MDGQPRRGTTEEEEERPPARQGGVVRAAGEGTQRREAEGLRAPGAQGAPLPHAAAP